MIVILELKVTPQYRPSSYRNTALSNAAGDKNYHLGSSMNMPRVVCPTTEWILTKRPSEIISKKRMPRVGDSLRTTKPTLRDHPKSCPNDRNHIADLWMPGVQVWPSATIDLSAPQVTIAWSTFVCQNNCCLNQKLKKLNLPRKICLQKEKMSKMSINKKPI